eukprot:PLAT7820.1.p1 GENE.PLAT7820.1~~PLAT7820.1.p1  ORF type:complete len:229 (+),score=74.39 PLAT7820.1:54-689(+)
MKFNGLLALALIAAVAVGKDDEGASLDSQQGSAPYFPLGMPHPGFNPYASLQHYAGVHPGFYSQLAHPGFSAFSPLSVAGGYGHIATAGLGGLPLGYAHGHHFAHAALGNALAGSYGYGYGGMPGMGMAGAFGYPGMGFGVAGVHGMGMYGGFGMPMLAMHPAMGLSGPTGLMNPYTSGSLLAQLHPDHLAAFPNSMNFAGSGQQEPKGSL